MANEENTGRVTGLDGYGHICVLRTWASLGGDSSVPNGLLSHGWRRVSSTFRPDMALHRQAWFSLTTSFKGFVCGRGLQKHQYSLCQNASLASPV